ncbi:hypothetical protein GWI33_006910 [Rhynchophorus ferrugineus]|uniref:Carbonic anhydrase n=1 Tax=Rhynchophorus ferrugineus TaxID=354439 RepID=A0A834IW27_RHYFE|nr:hypothetical protein GWI33_006910 [Rhynchophorus ferrugineus]
MEQTSTTTEHNIESVKFEDNNGVDGGNEQKIKDIFQDGEVYESPTDLNVTKTIPVENVPPLKWVNFELLPKKMKITNSGYTVILSAKWGQERPYITGGTLSGKYVFSQLHLHWGVNDMEGSEHTVDGCHHPGEMHVVTFKSCYLTQESALKETDGVAILVYLFKLQDEAHKGFSIITDALSGIAQAHTSMKIEPVDLNQLIKQFWTDYFMYKGSVSTSDCVHHITWMITRYPMAVSAEQIDSLRYLMDDSDELIKRNFRTIIPRDDRRIFHVLPSKSKYSTMLPLSDYDKVITQIYRMELELNSNPLYVLQGEKDLIRQKLIQMKKSEEYRNDENVNKKPVKYVKIMEVIKKYINNLF